jgi:hypothetical protein
MKSPFTTKKTTILIIFAFFLLSNSLTAQEQEEKEKKKEWEKHQIKFTPTRLFNTLYPGIEFSYEYRYGNYSSQLSAAYLCIPYFSNSATGFLFRFDEKFFFKKQPKHNRMKFYLSPEISYNYIKQNRNEDFVSTEYEQSNWEERNQHIYRENLDLQRQSIITNLKFGVQFKIKKLILEPNLGLGIGFHNIKHYNKPNANDKMDYRYGNKPGEYDPFRLIEQFICEEGNTILPNFTMSFKIGYTF